MGQKVIKISEEIYCIYTPSYFNCTYIIYRNQEVILIDTGMKSDASDVKRALIQLNIPLSRIKAILLTHWHNDHSAGTAELKQLTNCETYCHKNEAAYFEKEQSSWIRRLADYIPEYGILVLFKGLLGDTVPRPVKIDKIVQDGDLIHDTFEVVHSPGHTDGHVSYYDKKSKFLFAGDSLAVVRGKLRLMASIVTPDKVKALDSIVRSLTNNDIRVVCPGHREPLTINVNTEINQFLDTIRSQKKWPLLG